MPLSGGYSGGSSLTGAAVASALGYTPANESDTIDLLNSVAYLALLIGGLKGAVVQLTDGFDDNYADETGIDTTNSTGFTYVAGSVSNRGASAPESLQSLPYLTSDTGGGTTAGIAFASSEAGNSAYEAFSSTGGNSGVLWQSGSLASGATTTLGRTVGTNNGAFVLGAYSIVAASGYGAAYAPATWTLQGSNNTTTGADGTWTNLDAQSAQTLGGSSKTFTIANAANNAAYSAYRLVITVLNNGSYGGVPSNSPSLVVGAFKLLKYVPGGPIAMSLKSPSLITLKATPSRVGAYVLATMGGGIVNTDLTCQVSRDGATFTTGNLVAIATLGGKTLYELQGSDGNPGVMVTGQPSGQTPEYKILTTSVYLQTIYGVSVRAA